MLEANKKQVPLKSYFLEIRIDSVNQILKNKEKGSCPYKSLRHADNKIFFRSLSNAKLEGSAHVLLGEGKGKNLDMFLLTKGNFIMINEFRYTLWPLFYGSGSTASRLEQPREGSLLFTTKFPEIWPSPPSLSLYSTFNETCNLRSVF